MTVTTEVSKNGPYDPNGVTTSFAFTFKAHVSTDVRVVLVNADSELTDVSSSLYTVTINEGMGGSVVFASAPSSTSDLWILLDPDFKQEIEFTDGTRWQAKPVAKGYDRAAMRDLVLSRELARTIKVPFGQNGIELSESEFDALLGATRTPLMVTPLEYSGVGDNVADDTQAVIDALASGFSVWLPQGKTFKVTADIEITTDYQRLCGPGVLNFVGNCGVVVTGTVGCEVDITVDAPDHTGTCVKVLDADRVLIHRILVIDGNNVLYVERANTVTVKWVWALCTGFGVKWYGTELLRSDILDIGTCIIDPGNTEYGLEWDGNCHTFNCTFLGIVGGKGAKIHNSGNVSYPPAIGRFQNIQIDYPTEHGFQVLDGLDFDFVACYVLGSTTGSGLYVGPLVNSRNVRVSGGKFRGNARYGIENAGGVLLTGGNLDLQDNTLGETLGDVWSEFERVSLDDFYYMMMSPGGDPLLSFDDLDYVSYDRDLNVLRQFIGGNEVATFSAAGFSIGVGKQLLLPASTTSGSPLNFGEGVDPTSPAEGDVWLSGNVFKYRAQGVTNTIALEVAAPNQTRLISGGQVVNEGNLVFRVSAATYYIDGVVYEAAEQTVTLSAADGTNPRIDVLYLDTAGLFGKIDGTAAATPSEPDVAPTQLRLTFVYVPAAATSLPGVSNEDIYLENTEWTTSTSGTGFNANSTTNPFAGTKCIEGTTVANAAYVQLQRGTALTLDSYAVLVLKIRSKAAWTSGRVLRLQWFSAGVAKGSPVTVASGFWGFDSSYIAGYQQVAIPLSQFVVPAGTSINQLRITDAGGSIGFYIDNVLLQAQGSSLSQSGGDYLTMAQADARYARLTGLPFEMVIACSDETTALTAGTDKVTFRAPRGVTLTEVRASLVVAQTSGTTLKVDVNEAGASILGANKLTFDNGQKSTGTAAQSGITITTLSSISDAAIADNAEMTIDIDAVGDGTAKGLKVTLIGTRA